jgi:hypothetical protein
MGIAFFSPLDREMLAGVKGVDRYSFFFSFFPFLLPLLSGSQLKLTPALQNWVLDTYYAFYFIPRSVDDGDLLVVLLRGLNSLFMAIHPCVAAFRRFGGGGIDFFIS